jgi:TonB family protein
MNTRNDLTDLAQRLILRAARKAPAPLAARLQEEWLADLASRSGSLPRLRLALGCCWATAVITRDFSVPQLATSGAASGHRLQLGDLQHRLPLLSRRTLTFILIAGLHVLLIYCFASGFAQHVAASFPDVIHLTFPQESKPQPPPPPTATTAFKLKKIEYSDPAPQGPQNIDYPPDEPLGAKPGDGGGSLLETRVDPPTPHRIIGGPGKGFPTTDEYYPAVSRRISETGAATVRVCVDTQGRLSAAPMLTQSSGSRRIDDGALNLATAGSGHYRPSTDDGRPVSSCYPYRIRFVLN